MTRYHRLVAYHLAKAGTEFHGDTGSRRPKGAREERPIWCARPYLRVLRDMRSGELRGREDPAEGVILLTARARNRIGSRDSHLFGRLFGQAVPRPNWFSGFKPCFATGGPRSDRRFDHDRRRSGG